MTCRFCAARSYVYDTAVCVRCVARELARTPRRFAAATFQDWCEGKTQRAITDMRVLRDEERAIEVKEMIERTKAMVAA